MRKTTLALVVVIVLSSTMTIFSSASEARTYAFRETEITYIDTSLDQMFIDTTESENLIGKFSFDVRLVIDTEDPEVPHEVLVHNEEFVAIGAKFSDGVTNRFMFLQIFAQDGLVFGVGFTTIFGRLGWGWCLIDSLDNIGDLQMVGLDQPIEMLGYDFYLDIESISMTTELLPPENIENAEITYRAIYQLYDWRIPPEEGALRVVDFYKNLSNAFLTSTEALWGSEWTQMHNYFAVFFGAFLVASVASWITFYIKRRR